MRNRQLDILRALAVLLVLGRHAEGPRIWAFVGWAGVDLFFVLSGFLISGLLFAEFLATNDIGWKRFFIRRGFKIYPAYYAMILATFLWQVAKHQAVPWKLYLPEILMYQNYSAHIWPHTWSLAVEEHFYVFLPLLLLLLIRLPTGRNSSEPFRKVPYACAIIGLVCLLLRFYRATQLPDLANNWGSILFPSHLRIDSLFFGVFLGYLHHFHRPEVCRWMSLRWFRILLLCASVALVSPCLFLPLQSPVMLVPGLTSLYLGFGGILICAVYGHRSTPDEATKQSRKFGIGGLAAYIGKYSYSIYLWHPMVGQHDQAVLRFLWPRIAGSGLFCANIATELAVGIVLSILIEWPAIQFRDRYFPSLQSVRALK